MSGRTTSAKAEGKVYGVARLFDLVSSLHSDSLLFLGRKTHPRPIMAGGVRVAIFYELPGILLRESDDCDAAGRPGHRPIGDQSIGGVILTQKITERRALEDPKVAKAFHRNNRRSESDQPSAREQETTSRNITSNALECKFCRI
jgi:hypothetical protein